MKTKSFSEKELKVAVEVAVRNESEFLKRQLDLADQINGALIHKVSKLESDLKAMRDNQCSTCTLWQKMKQEAKS